MLCKGKYDQTSEIQSDQAFNNQRHQGHKHEIDRLQREYEEVRGILVSNMESLIERGENVDELLERSEELENAAKSFKMNCRQALGRFRWQANKVII